jgi:outer membrane protein assembly factor BamB
MIPEKPRTVYSYGILAIVIFTVIFNAAACNHSRGREALISAAPSASADDDIYVADDAGRIKALRPDSSVQWTISLGNEMAKLVEGITQDLRVDYLAARPGQKVYGLATQETGRTAGQTILFAIDSGRLSWFANAGIPEPNTSPIAIGETAIYESGEDGTLYAFGMRDGRLLWKYHVSEGALGSPTIGADGTIYVTGPQLNLHAISPEGYQKWVQPINR